MHIIDFEQMYLLFDLSFLDHQQRRESLVQFQDQEPEASPIIDTSHILHNPSMYCIQPKKKKKKMKKKTL